MLLPKLLLMCGFLVIAAPAHALRCGGKLMADGTPQGKVLRYCGEPESIQVRTIYRAGLPRHSGLQRSGSRHAGDPGRELLYADRAYVETHIEEWTYNFGPHRLMRMIRFENGLVTSITQLGRGYH